MIFPIIAGKKKNFLFFFYLIEKIEWLYKKKRKYAIALLLIFQKNSYLIFNELIKKNILTPAAIHMPLWSIMMLHPGYTLFHENQKIHRRGRVGEGREGGGWEEMVWFCQWIIIWLILDNIKASVWLHPHPSPPLSFIPPFPTPSQFYPLPLFPTPSQFYPPPLFRGIPDFLLNPHFWSFSHLDDYRGHFRSSISREFCERTL